MGKGGRPFKVESELEYLDGYVEKTDLKGIKHLINEYGADCYDPDKRTFLIKASSKGNVDVLNFMIENGADVNFQDRIGYSALHFSAQNKFPEITTILIDNGADIDIKDSYGNPPIWTAIFNAKGDFTLIKLLLSTGADINSKNNSGKSPKEIGELTLGELFADLLKEH